MNDSTLFPRDILNQSVYSRKKYFASKTINHPKLEKAIEDLKNSLLFEDSSSIITVYGPTGVGKTTMKRSIERYIVEKYYNDLYGTPGEIFYASVEAQAPDSGSFNWRIFWENALTEMKEILPQKKQLYITDFDEAVGVNKLRIKKNPSSADLMSILINSFKYRNTKFFIIDEAQHLKKVTSGKKLIDQMDTIKSLANNSDVKILLFGTYELIDMLNLNGQIARRSTHIHLPRYKYSEYLDLKSFRSILVTLQKHLPVEKEPNFLPSFDYFYERTFGCIGLLKEWLLRALVVSMKRGLDTISPELIRETAMTSQAAERILTELKEGEKYHAEEKMDLKSELDMDDCFAFDSKPAKAEKTAKGGNRRPGNRKPNRDPVLVT